MIYCPVCNKGDRPSGPLVVLYCAAHNEDCDRRNAAREGKRSTTAALRQRLIGNKKTLSIAAADAYFMRCTPAGPWDQARARLAEELNVKLGGK